jgi:response regulator RpfG family c-di-GMP phosphodiesterase
MPEMDGYEVFDALKNSDKTAHIPVVFITGLDDISNRKKCLQLGAADYIIKPFDDQIVKLRVHQQIRNMEQTRMIEHLSNEIKRLEEKLNQ